MAVLAGAASAGTMVASVLETLGYFYQAHILDAMTGPFKGSLGGFIYLVGVAITIFSIAVRGGYRFGPWLLIGPPLFFSMIIPRDTVGSAEWRFADMARDQAKVDREVQKAFPAAGAQASVSRLFARYNRLVSRTVQEMVKLINQEKAETDKTFILKAQYLSRIYSKNVDSPGLDTLLKHALLNSDCGYLVEAAKISQAPLSSPRAKKAADEQLQSLNNPRILVVQVVADYIAILNTTFNDPQGADQAALAVLRAPPNTMSTDPRVVKNTPLSCIQIWYYSLQGLKLQAKDNLTQMAEEMQLNQIQASALLRQVASATGVLPMVPPGTVQQDQAQLINILAPVSAKFILRNAADHGGFAGRIQEVAEMTREFKHIEAPLEPGVVQTEAARGRASEYAEKTRLMTTASNLPYYQGLLLFFLSVAFPFFAMLLLVPGKHAGFLMWFVLWMWVKSWDVGMAIVMQIDDILFSMMSVNKADIQGALNVESIQAQFEVAMAALRLQDPSFQMTTYYNIIAACLTAIPVVSSQLIVGSMSGGAGIIAQGMKMMSEDFGNSSLKAHSQMAVSNLRHQMQDLAMTRSAVYARNMSGYSDVQKDKNGRMFQLPTQKALMSGATKTDLGLKVTETKIRFGPTERGTDSTRRVDHNKKSIRDSVEIASGMGVLSGMARGASDGSGGKFFSTTNARQSELSKTIMRVGGAGGQAVSQITAAIGKFASESAEFSISPAAKAAMFDAVYSDRGQELAATGRLYDMLEVPWSFDAPLIQDVEYEQKYIRAEAELEAEMVRALSGSLSKAAGN